MNNDIKIALLTCYLNNYGACLQAYALQSKINEICGQDCCEILQYQPFSYGSNFDNNYLHRIRTFIKNIVNYRNGIKTMKKNRQRQLSVNRYSKFRRKNLKFRDGVFQIEDFYHMEDIYTAYVSGSDQLWNTDFFKGCNQIYFLDFVQENRKKIAYAASIGLPDIPEKYRADFKKYVESFNLVTMRESRGKEIVDALTDKECEAVLDPTLLYDNSFWTSLIDKSRIPRNFSGRKTSWGKKNPYIFCYTFRNKSNLPLEIIDSVARLTGYEVIAISYTEEMRNSSYTRILDAGPIEFLSLIKDSAIVITDSFHGTAISLNFNKQFYVFLRDDDDNENNMNSRIYSILNLTGLNSRLVHGAIKKIDEIDYSPVNDILNRERSRCSNLLKGALYENINKR